MPNVSNGYAIKDAMHFFISDNHRYENKMDTFNENVVVNWDEIDNQNNTVDPQPNSLPTNCSDENNEEILQSKVQSTTPDSVSSTDTQEIPPTLTQSLAETSSNDELSIMLDLIGLQGLNLRSQLHMAHVRENELLSEFIHQSESPAEILRRLFLEVDSLRQENRKLVAEFDQTKLDNQQQKQMLQDVLQTIDDLKITTMPNSFEHELKQELRKHIPDNLSPSESLSKDKETRIVYSVQKTKENGSNSPHHLPSSQSQTEVGKEELGKPNLSYQHQITTLTAQNHILQLKYATCKRELATKVGELNALLHDARNELHYTKKENGEFKRLIERNLVKMQSMAERIAALESTLEAICYDNELLNSQLNESLRIFKHSFQGQFHIPQELARENFILQQHIKNLFKEKNILKKKLNAMKRRQSAESMYDEGSPLEDTSFPHLNSGIPKSMARSYLMDNPRRAWHNTKDQNSSSSEHETIEKEQLHRGKKSRLKSSKKSPKLVTFGSENKEVDEYSSEDQNLFHSDVLKDYLNVVESSKHNTHNEISSDLKPEPSYSTTPEELRLSDLQDRSPLPPSEHLSGSASSWSYYAISENKLSTSIPLLTSVEPQSFQYKGHELLKENKKFLEHLKRKSQEHIMQILKQDLEIDHEIETLLKHASKPSLQEANIILPIENTLSFKNSNEQEKVKENHIELDVHSRESSSTSLTSGISSSHDPSVLFNLEQTSSGQSPITTMANDSHSESTLWKPTPVSTVMHENNDLSDICNIHSGFFLNEISPTEKTEIQELEAVNMEATNTFKTVNIGEAVNINETVNMDGPKLIASNNLSNATGQFHGKSPSYVSDHNINSLLVAQEKEFNEENNPIPPCQENSPSVPLENMSSVPSSSKSSINCENSAVSQHSNVMDTPNNLAKSSLSEDSQHSAVCLSSSLSFERESFA